MSLTLSAHHEPLALYAETLASVALARRAPRSLSTYEKYSIDNVLAENSKKGFGRQQETLLSNSAG